jgi:hypothetical protein
MTDGREEAVRRRSSAKTLREENGESVSTWWQDLMKESIFRIFFSVTGWQISTCWTVTEIQVLWMKSVITIQFDNFIIFNWRKVFIQWNSIPFLTEFQLISMTNWQLFSKLFCFISFDQRLIVHSPIISNDHTNVSDRLSIILFPSSVTKAHPQIHTTKTITMKFSNLLCCSPSPTPDPKLSHQADEVIRWASPSVSLPISLRILATVPPDGSRATRTIFGLNQTSDISLNFRISQKKPIFVGKMIGICHSPLNLDMKKSILDIFFSMTCW